MDKIVNLFDWKCLFFFLHKYNLVNNFFKKVYLKTNKTIFLKKKYIVKEF